VGRHQRRAALPAGDYTRPASLDATGLIVTVYGESGGVEGTFDFGVLPGSSELRRAFAAALDRKSGPAGTWRAGATCVGGYQAARTFLRWLQGQDDPPRSAAEITAATWTQWRLSLPATPGARQLLATMRALMPKVAGLPADTLKVIDRRLPKGPPPREAAYSYREFERIRAAAATTFAGALVRIRSNRDHLRRWYDGQVARGSAEWLIGEALDCLVRSGDVPLSTSCEKHGREVRQPYRRALGGSEPDRTWGRLYLTSAEVFAAAVLLVASESWNKSVLHRMRIPEHDPATGDGFEIHMVEVNKRRRPVGLRYTTNNLLDAGPGTPGRLMGQVIEATEMARQTLELSGRATDRLLVWRRAYPSRRERFALGMPHDSDTFLHDGDGAPVKVSLRRLRRTVQVLVRKEPAQNSQETHESVYVLRDPATRDEARKVVAQGLVDAVDQARVMVKMRVVLGDDADHLIELSDDPELAKAIDNGDLDTATGACTDFTNSPFTGPGLPCTASFLLCLACPNAVAARRHLPRLVYLRTCLNELRAVVDPAVWEQDWHEHFLRVSSLLDTHTTEAEQTAAGGQATPVDRARIDQLLRRRLDA
jgi:hypothetical protein